MSYKSLTTIERVGMVGFPNYRSRNRRLALVVQGAKVLFSTAWSTHAFAGMEYGHNGGVIASRNREVLAAFDRPGSAVTSSFFIPQTVEVFMSKFNPKNYGTSTIKPTTMLETLQQCTQGAFDLYEQLTCLRRLCTETSQTTIILDGAAMSTANTSIKKNTGKICGGLASFLQSVLLAIRKRNTDNPSNDEERDARTRCLKGINEKEKRIDIALQAGGDGHE